MSARVVTLLARRARHVWPPKDAAATLDFGLDWSARLVEADVIEGSTFELPRGLVAVRASHAAKVTAVWISGGSAGESYEVFNRVKTSRGLEIEQAVKLKIKSK